MYPFLNDNMYAASEGAGSSNPTYDYSESLNYDPRWQDPSRNHNPLQSTTDGTSDIDPKQLHLPDTNYTATKADGDPMFPIIDDSGQSSSFALSAIGNHLDDFPLTGDPELELESSLHGPTGQAGPHNMDLSEYDPFEPNSQTEEQAGEALSTRRRHALIGLAPVGKGPEYFEDQRFRDSIEFMHTQFENILDNCGNPQQIAGMVIQFQQALKNCSEFMDKKCRAMNIHPQSDDTRSLISLQPGDSKVYIYKCQYPSCRHRFFDNRGTFERHLKTQHFPRIIYCCLHRSPQGEQCKKKFPRKDNYQDHFTKSHKRGIEECSTAEKDHIQPGFSRSCFICFRDVLDRDDFYECFIKHCEIPENERQPSRPTRSGKDDSGEINESDDDHDPGPFEIASQPATGSQKGKANLPGKSRKRSGSRKFRKRLKQFTDESTRFSQKQNSMSRRPPLGMSLPRVVSDQPQARPSRIDDHSDQLPMDPSSLFPPQSRRQDGITLSARCTNCQHDYSTCEECFSKTVSEDSCHNCRTVQVPTGQSASPMQQSRSYQGDYGYDRSVDLQPSFPGHGYFQQYNERSPHSQTHQTSRIGSFRSQPDNSNNYGTYAGPGGNTYHAYPVLDVPMPIEHDLVQPLSISKINQPGLWSTDLSARPKIFNWDNYRGKYEAGSDKNDKNPCAPDESLPLRFSISDLSTLSSETVNTCPCDCNWTARVFRKATVNLASGMTLEMHLKLISEDPTANILRSHVEVAVRIVGNPASVNKLSSGQQAKDIKALGNKAKRKLTRCFDRPREEEISDGDSGSESVFSEDPQSLVSSWSDLSSDDEVGGYTCDLNTYEASSIIFYQAETETTPSEHVSDIVRFQADLQSSTEYLAECTNSQPPDVDYATPGLSEYTQISEFYFRRLLWLIYVLSDGSADDRPARTPPKPELD